MHQPDEVELVLAQQLRQQSLGVDTDPGGAGDQRPEIDGDPGTVLPLPRGRLLDWGDGGLSSGPDRLLPASAEKSTTALRQPSGDGGGPGFGGCGVDPERGGASAPRDEC